MLIYLLVVFFLALTYVSYKVFDMELSNPAVIFSFMYFISSFCALLNINNFNIKLAPETFLLLFLGAIEFVLICYFVKKFFQQKYKLNTFLKQDTPYVDRKNVIILSVYSVILIVLLLYNIVLIANQYGEYNSFSGALSIFKTQTSYSNSVSLPHYLNLMFKVMELSSYILIYCFLSNIICNEELNIIERFKKNMLYLTIPVLYIIKELLSSSRITILQLSFATLVMGLIIWYSRYNWGQKIGLPFLITLSLVGVLGLGAFYSSAALIGRANSKNLVDYITAYAGGSIECLNQYLQHPNPVDNSDIVGNETFYPLIRSLDKYKITNFDIENKQTAHLSFRYYFSQMIGNVYTAYRRWHHDFGYFGVSILNGFMSLVFSICYYCFKFKKNNNHMGLYLSVYSYIVYALFLHPIDSYFYTTVFQLTFITNIILFIFLYVLLFYVKFDKNSKQILFNNKNIGFFLKPGWRKK